MTDEQIRKIIEGPQDYEDIRENTFRSMLGDFYNRKMLFTATFVWVWGVAVVAGAVYCGVRFFDAEQTRAQIMYAAIFVCCIQFLALTKIFAWQMIHRNGILREIKRLELRIAELSQKGDGFSA
jgi:Family of unknown function (DUF6768)